MKHIISDSVGARPSKAQEDLAKARKLRETMKLLKRSSSRSQSPTTKEPQQWLHQVALSPLKPNEKIASQRYTMIIVQFGRYCYKKKWVNLRFWFNQQKHWISSCFWFRYWTDPFTNCIPHCDKWLSGKFEFSILLKASNIQILLETATISDAEN